MTTLARLCPAAVAAGGSGAAKPKQWVLSNQDFHFVVYQSPTSLMLAESMFDKKVLPRVTVRFRHPALAKELELVMKDVRVSSYQTGGSGYGNEGPMDQISLSFNKAKMTVGAKGAKHSADLDATR